MRDDGEDHFSDISFHANVVDIDNCLMSCRTFEKPRRVGAVSIKLRPRSNYRKRKEFDTCFHFNLGES